jgi:ATP-dependent Clp protease ATP-binding subunit ClpB
MKNGGGNTLQQFINGSDEAWADLESRAIGRCIRFRDQEMPTGSTPKHAHVGFEIDPITKIAILYVQYGVDYRANNEELRSWFQTGEKHFQTFRLLKNWICSNLASAYSFPLKSTEVRGPGQLTDIQAVRNMVREVDRPLLISEENLFEELSQKVRGQSMALRNLAGQVLRHSARTKPSRPATLFVVGPTGVGKTRTAECLANVLRRKENEDNSYGFVRLDMAEYQESHRVSQLIGSPQGYVGYGEGSLLIDALNANPRTVVLFDEIEKAHPAILRTLMNAMDAGHFSTAARESGSRKIDCRYAIFIFTSNLEAENIITELEERNGFGRLEVEDEVCRRQLCASGMAPEIIGRIGSFHIFCQLSPEARAEIIALAIVELAAEYGLTVQQIAPSVIMSVLKKVRTDNFGVRPARYLIDDLLGRIFAETAAKQIKEAVEVLGPPFRCERILQVKNDGKCEPNLSVTGHKTRGNK